MGGVGVIFDQDADENEFDWENVIEISVGSIQENLPKNVKYSLTKAMRAGIYCTKFHNTNRIYRIVFIMSIVFCEKKYKMKSFSPDKSKGGPGTFKVRRHDSDTFEGNEGGPPRQSTVVVYPAKRELIGSDPTTGSAIFEYRLGVSFSAGSRIRWMKVDLVCDAEGDCPGSTLTTPFIPLNGELPGGFKRDIAQNEFFNIGGYTLVENSKVRYNKVRVTWQSLDGSQWSSLPPGKEFSVEDQTMVNIFECSLAPSAGLDGNQIFSCRTFEDNSYAEFLSVPSNTIIRLDPNSSLRKENHSSRFCGIFLFIWSVI